MTHSFFPFAAPSFVLPASVAENAQFLAHKVQEVGLCFFETKACLAYTEQDLPVSLQALPLRWHVHLPVDLVWSRRQGGGAHAAKMALAVLAKAVFLRPRMAVLHPPVFEEDILAQETLLREFLETWCAHTSVPILLENIRFAPLYDLNSALFNATELTALRSKQVHKGRKKANTLQAFGICLDVAHMLTFGQEAMLERHDLLSKVQLVHWSAPGALAGQDKHKPLTQLTAEQRNVLQKLVPLLPASATHMIEIFHWQGVCDSVHFLRAILEQSHVPQI